MTAAQQLSFDDELPSRRAVTLAEPATFAVEVIRSARRRKTAEARMVGDRLEIRIPARLTKREEAEMVSHFVAKFERRRSAEAVDLDQRANRLAKELGLPSPLSIRWVTNQARQWGSCTPVDGSVRISDRLVGYPRWVLDYVIVHELAHLVELNHSLAFWQLVERYPMAERARGFLIAKGWEGD